MALPSLWPSRHGGEAFEPLASLRREMDRLFDDFRRGWPEAGEGGVMTPRVDVSETDTELKVEAELPGVAEKDVEVTLRDGGLTIKGEKRHEKEEKGKSYYLAERSYGSFTRTIPLPFEADPDTVEARFAKGVLTVTVPKPPEAKAKTKKIEVKPGA